MLINNTIIIANFKHIQNFTSISKQNAKIDIYISYLFLSTPSSYYQS